MLYLNKLKARTFGFLKKIIQIVLYKLCVLIVFFNLQSYFVNISIIDETCEEIVSRYNRLNNIRFRDHSKIPVVFNYQFDLKRHKTNYESGIIKIVDYVNSGARSECFLIHEYFPDNWMIIMQVHEATLEIIAMDIVQANENEIRYRFRVLSKEDFNELASELGIRLYNCDYFYNSDNHFIYINAEYIRAMEPKHFILPNNINWYIENAKNVDQAIKIFESKFVTITNASRYHNVMDYVFEQIEKHSNIDDQIFIFDKFSLNF